MSSEAGVVIVGAGHAGAQLALSLRQLKYPGRVVLLGDEAEPPYQRPPLSKSYMTGKVELAGLLIRTAPLYAQQGIEWRGSSQVRAIRREAKTIELTTGESLAYDTLVLATGTRNRLLEVQGDLDGIAYLRSFDDARRLRDRLAEPSSVVIVGGGFIGLEFAAVARTMGHDVTVLEAAERVMSRALSAHMSEFFIELHRRAGTRVLCGAKLTQIEGGSSRVERVCLDDGSSLPASIVLIDIGVLPNDGLAREAGLEIENGIRVDEHLRTADPHIHAIGDCASCPTRFRFAGASTRVRLESVQNAVDQAKYLAARLTGSTGAYDAVPWFWSDQFSAKLQIAGLTNSSDDWLVAPGATADSFGLHCFAGGEWVGYCPVPLICKQSRWSFSRMESAVADQRKGWQFTLCAATK